MIELPALLEKLGIPPGAAMEGEALLSAALAIAVAWGAGMLIALVIAPRVRAIAERLLDRESPAHGDRMGKVVGAAVATLLFTVEAQLPMFDAFGRLIVGAAFGLSVAYLVYQLARAVGIGGVWASLLAAVLGIAAMASHLGGLPALMRMLDAITIGMGKYSFSVLDVVSALLVLALLFVLTRLALRMAGRFIRHVGGLDGSQQVLFQKLATIAIIGIAVFVGIDLLGIDLTALTVFSGAFGLAIGFGLQKTIGNLLAGIILLFDRSIKPGDVIVVNDTFGWVNKIGIRAVSVLTRDGKEFLIPNENLMTQQVENWSFSDRNVRVHIPVGVSYSCDIHLAQQLMLQAARETPRVLDNPPPNVWLTDFGDNAVEHDILVWISDAEQGVGNVKSAVLNRLWDLFKAHDIGIPFPQRDVHIRSMVAGSPPQGTTQPR
jgi:small-conductance mechanosensitive channel